MPTFGRDVASAPPGAESQLIEGGYITQRFKKMRGLVLVLATVVALSLIARSRAGTEENADDVMLLHQVEIALDEAGNTKNLDLMLSLFADEQ